MKLAGAVLAFVLLSSICAQAAPRYAYEDEACCKSAAAWLGAEDPDFKYDLVFGGGLPEEIAINNVDVWMLLKNSGHDSYDRWRIPVDRSKPGCPVSGEGTIVEVFP
jgi:hypothetical protein